MGALLYQILRVIIFILAKLIFRLQIVGHSNIPKKGGVIIAANHASYLDPPLIASSMLRKVNFMAMAELFKKPLYGTIYRMLGAFPVRREEADSGAIRHAVKLLRDGKTLLIFPEGTRSSDGRLQEPKAGIGAITSLSCAKVVPTFIKGTEKALPRDSRWIKAYPIAIYFGKPLEFGKDGSDINNRRKDRRSFYADINMKIMEEIAKLQQEAILREPNQYKWK